MISMRGRMYTHNFGCVYPVTPIDSFDAAEKLYESTKPVNERDHGTKRNIRPVINRRDKYTVIVKTTNLKKETMYEIRDYGWYSNNAVGTAIRWERVDGYDTCTIFNDGCLSTRKKTLKILMHSELDMTHTDTKTYLHTADGQRRYFGRQGDGQKVTLRVKPNGVTNNKLVIVDNPAPEPMFRKRVDKEDKAKIKPYIENCREWVLSIAPIYMETARDFSAYRESLNVIRRKWFDDLLEIFKDETHEDRVHLVIHFLYMSPSIKNNPDILLSDDPRAKKKLKEIFNRYVNNIFNLNKIVVEYIEE